MQTVASYPGHSHIPNVSRYTNSMLAKKLISLLSASPMAQVKARGEKQNLLPL
jgi:hypothetical protein